MKEKEHEILSRREKKKQIRIKLKEIERLKEELQYLNSDKRRSQIDLMIRIGQLKEKTADEFVEKKKEEMLLKIARLEKETYRENRDQ